ncbi:unnamed protein product (macronuclear) [Paramecium tetraurelia]|uniref:SP-RING-type domain-containing protein n=1 Tax=Paramecium tetraurelia TaxID=5888 RepID=A0BVL1_PARTE|nr:uncharacterized protein GSPATT00005824001 [Paramecium tetraurelia]CAK62578.1 unnamed protein product [Paramecium tetraurelia]|eukprot:XP_001429976.1 hypothetical protein (macronuclear) [Paramecium tetraurelia strain d4-2]
MEHRQLLETLVVDLLNSPVNPLIQYRDFQIQHICKQIGVNEYGGQRDAIFFKHFASHFISYLNEKNELSSIIQQAQISRNQSKAQELQENKQIALPQKVQQFVSPICVKPKNDTAQIIDDEIGDSNKRKIDLETFVPKSYMPVPNFIGVNFDINNNQFNKTNDNSKHTSTKTASTKQDNKPKDLKVIPDLIVKKKNEKTPQKIDNNNKTYTFLEPVEFKETQLNRSLQSKTELQNNCKKKKLSPSLDLIKKKDIKPFKPFKPDSQSESLEIRTSEDLSMREDSIKRKENIKLQNKQEKKLSKDLENFNKKEKLQKIEKKKHSEADIKQQLEKSTKQIIPMIDKKERKKKERLEIDKLRKEKRELERQQQLKEKNQILERLEKEKQNKEKLEKERLEKERLDKFEKERTERLEKERQDRIELLEKQRQEREKQDRLEKERQERLERSDKHRQKETQELESIIEKLLCANPNDSSKVKKNQEQVIIVDSNDKVTKKLEKEQSKLEKPQCNYCKNMDSKTIEIQDGVRICTQCLLVSINPFQKIITKLAYIEYKYSGKENAKTCQTFTIDTSTNCNLEIRCVALNKQGLYDLTFPMSCTLLINGVTIKEIRPLQEKSSLKKRRDTSIYINVKDLIRQNNYSKKFLFSIIERLAEQQYRKDTVGSIYCFGLFLVEPLNVIQTIEKFKSLDIQPKIKADQSKKEIQVAKTIISLYCQFTLELIQIPAKGEFCQHEQCFCLCSFLEMMIKVEHKKWICPICKKVCFHLVIDKYQLFIIERIKQLEISIDQLALDHNGQLDKDEQINLILQDQTIKTYQDIVDRGYRNINKINKNEDEDDIPIVTNAGKSQNLAIILIDD